MSVSIKRIVYEDSPFAGSDVGNWLHNHIGYDSVDAQTTRVQIRQDELDEHLKAARECDGKCEFFDRGKERHDEITEEMSAKIPRLLAELKKDWVDLEVWW